MQDIRSGLASSEVRTKGVLPGSQNVSRTARVEFCVQHRPARSLCRTIKIVRADRVHGNREAAAFKDLFCKRMPATLSHIGYMNGPLRARFQKAKRGVRNVVRI